MERIKGIIWILSAWPLVISSCQGVQQQMFIWSVGPPPQHGYAYHVALAEQDHIYVAGGLNDGAFEVFDITSAQWSSLPPLPTPRAFSGGTVLNTSIYLLGGLDTTNRATSVVERFALRTKTWSTVSNLSFPRSRFAAVTLDGKIYAIGGLRDADGRPGGNLHTLEVYDPATNAWSQKKDMPTARHGHSAVVVNNKILVVGGYTDKGETGIVEESGIVEEYDPEQDQWMTKAPMPTPRGFFGLVVLDNFVYAIAGRVRGDTGPIERYDVRHDRWTVLPPLPNFRNRFGITASHGFIYIIGGENQPRNMVIGTRKN